MNSNYCLFCYMNYIDHDNYQFRRVCNNACFVPWPCISAMSRLGHDLNAHVHQQIHADAQS